MSENKVLLKVKRLDPEAKLPAYAYAGDAGMDLYANENVTLMPNERRAIPTGLAVAIPEGYAGFLLPRSGMALMKGLSLANTPGLIDSHYRGEIKIAAINLDNEQVIHIGKGERIAQLVIMKVPFVKLVETKELDDTDRGTGGFGSSGA